MLGSHGETGVVAEQAVPQLRRGLIQGPGISQAQLGYQPVLEGASRTFHPAFGLRRTSEDLPDPQFL